jgi:hypothetical protein
MKIVVNHNSAAEREETPHSNKSGQKKARKLEQTVSVALKRRARSVMKDRSVDAQSRAMIRYGLETNDPWLAELVRRVDAGQSLFG